MNITPNVKIFAENAINRKYLHMQVISVAGDWVEVKLESGNVNWDREKGWINLAAWGGAWRFTIE